MAHIGLNVSYIAVEGSYLFYEGHRFGREACSQKKILWKSSIDHDRLFQSNNSYH